MESKDTGNQLVGYARAILAVRVVGISMLLIFLIGAASQLAISTSIVSEISLLGNDGLTTNNFTYINRIFSYEAMLFIFFLIMFFTLNFLLLLYLNFVVKKTLELTDTANAADLRRKVKEKGGIVKLSLSRRGS